MSSANALYLLADHVKLSLLERQRAKALDLESDSQDGHISRSLDQFRDGLEALEKERQRLEEAGEERLPNQNRKALNIADALPSLQKQYDDLTSQFHGFSNPSTSATTTHPNDPSLAEDFAHATTVPAHHSSSSSSAAAQAPAKGSLRTSSSTGSVAPGSKSVRFQDNHDAEDPSADALFSRYRDDPAAVAAREGEGYRDEAEGMQDNAQIHAYHSRILAQQDEQLDALGESISRQRELSMQIGDELEDQVAMLEEGERLVDRHQGRLDRARRQVGKIARTAGESKQMVAIIALIIILVLLIAVLK